MTTPLDMTVSDRELMNVHNTATTHKGQNTLNSAGVSAANGLRVVAKPDVGHLTTQFAIKATPRVASGTVTATRVVLCVDDDEEGAQIASKYLSRLGYKVLIAPCGEQARIMLRQNSIDLILMDVMLPDVSGTTLLRELRRDRAFADMPVLMTTALDKPEEMVAALNGGANDYITKPYDFEVLAARIAAHLRTKTKHDWERQVQSGFSKALISIGAVGPTDLWGEALLRWQTEVLNEIERVLPNRAVGLWHLSSVGEMTLRTGCALKDALGLVQCRTLERTLAPLVQAGAVWLPIADGTNIVSVISIELLSNDYRDVLVRMVSEFARQLSAQLGANSGRSRRPSPASATAEGLEADQVYVCPQCRNVYSSASRVCPVDGAATQSWQGPLSRIIAERYHLERWLGEGGMGSVFQAYDPRLARHVAVKVLNPALSTNDDFRSRFVAEATLCARLKHPHIVDVYDFGEASAGAMYIVMEWLDGTDLAGILAQQGPGRPTQVAAVLEQCAQALDFAHRTGVIHRDVKPSNILLLHAGRPEIEVRLVDFGVARRLTSERSHPGVIVGTPKYMPPEQLLGGRIGPGSDTFALAAVVCELLAGPQANRRGVNSAHLGKPPVDWDNPSFASAPEAFRTLITAAFQPDIRDRPPSVLAWAQELSPVIAGFESATTQGWKVGRVEASAPSS